MNSNRSAPGAAAALLVEPRLRSLPTAFGLVLLCLVPGMLAVVLRPPAPLDELRYLAVAWEMWRDGDFLVPRLNGVAYSHKPPVLFWLIHAGWAVLGLNDWWPRLVPVLAGLAGAGMSRRLARALWPDDHGTAMLAPWLLAGCIAWLFCTQMVMFDVLLTAWVLLGMWALWNAAHHNRMWSWLALGLAIGGGLLTKGPVVFMQLLVPAALAPLWESGLRRPLWRWYARLLTAAASGIGLALLWAVPAARRGGPEYAAAILWQQTAGRMADSFAHQRPWWFYLPVLPLLFLPWIVLPAAWRQLPRIPRDNGLAFLLTWLVAVTATMSLVSGKQPHYLLPLLPALAIVAARCISAAPHDASAANRLALGAVPALLSVSGGLYLLWSARSHGAGWSASGAAWALAALPACLWIPRAGTLAVATRRAALAMGVTFIALLAGLARNPVAAGYDMRPAARMVRQLQDAGVPVATNGHYQGQLTYLGHLARPVPVVPREDLPAWAAEHAGAHVFSMKDPLPAGIAATPVAEFPYRSSSLRIWRIRETPLPAPPATG